MILVSRSLGFLVVFGTCEGRSGRTVRFYFFFGGCDNGFGNFKGGRIGWGLDREVLLIFIGSCLRVIKVCFFKSCYFVI